MGDIYNEKKTSAQQTTTTQSETWRRKKMGSPTITAHGSQLTIHFFPRKNTAAINATKVQLKVYVVKVRLKVSTVLQTVIRTTSDFNR